MIRVAGIAVLAALWLVPLGQIGAFPAHMLRHMGLVAVAAPLLVIGFPRLTRPFAQSPLFATVLEFALVWGWHAPALHGATRLGAGWLVAEQATFLAVGLILWASVLRGDALAGAGALLLTSMHMTLLGALLILAPRDLYAAWCGTTPNLAGQQWGGMLMLAIGTPVYLGAGLWRVAAALRIRGLA